MDECLNSQTHLWDAEQILEKFCLCIRNLAADRERIRHLVTKDIWGNVLFAETIGEAKDILNCLYAIRSSMIGEIKNSTPEYKKLRAMYRPSLSKTGLVFEIIQVP
jgi:hypothetical protein